MFRHSHQIKTSELPYIKVSEIHVIPLGTLIIYINFLEYEDLTYEILCQFFHLNQINENDYEKRLIEFQ